MSKAKSEASKWNFWITFSALEIVTGGMATFMLGIIVGTAPGYVGFIIMLTGGLGVAWIIYKAVKNG